MDRTEEDMSEHSFQDEGDQIQESIVEEKKHFRKTQAEITLDPTCISCNKTQGDVIKKFKIACLSYKPSTVVYRNIEFGRNQLLIFRKFLMGQCCKIIQVREPYVRQNMSTKRVFDESYLYLQEMNNDVYQSQSHPMVIGQTKNSYIDVASKYWNLMYHHPRDQSRDLQTKSSEELGQTLNNQSEQNLVSESRFGGRDSDTRKVIHQTYNINQQSSQNSPQKIMKIREIEKEFGKILPSPSGR